MTLKRNVLVVDDDDVVHFISHKILSTFTCINKIYSAYNGKEALEMLQHGCQGLMMFPSVVLLDLHMPVMDGFQFIREAKEMECLQSERIITVMFSSTIDANEIERAGNLGIEYFFSKPLVLEKIESVFRKEFY